MPSIPPTLMIMAAVVGAMAACAGVIVTVLIFLWNKLDKQFDDLKTRQNRQFDALRSDLKDGLGKLEAKVDRLLESHLPNPC
ncbi:hypothetical protein [Candidatus Synechococcus spongiarum]|uniref:Uncharacterized protein n=1 Tax=Candidatus Synechococcus spongiarum TaxID=431041 RepID=A0A165AGD3_9SYNE|nr:hypothetical protein [Candidatus Synechococcus spongiarum]SAY39142.1 hypothetical protein FLM9_1206 [Candidatus Synechococcus spongiarum]